MKLNKPEVSQAQTELEEYVDFLLTDLTNVTPIDSKRKSKIAPVVQKLNLNADSEPSSSAITVVDDYLNKAIDDGELNNESAEAEIEQAIKSEHAQITEPDQDQEKKLSAKKSETASETIIEKAAKNSHESETQTQILTNAQAQVPKQTSTAFELESEQNELKKWDAVLTKERETQILSMQAAEQEVLTNQIKVIQPEQHESAHPEPDQRLANVEQLLARISLATQAEVEPNQKKDSKTPPRAPIYDAEPEIEGSDGALQDEALLESNFIQRKASKTRDILPEVFQTLLFNVGKMPLAVPLLKLGGIVHMDEDMDITPLVGTPDWFLGLIPNDRGNLMVVDTRQFLMPEQKKDTEQNYEYLIVLDNSNWALACHSVGDAKNLTLNDIRWSEKSSKRPWFGGMVVEYMSALIEVDELINMLANHISD
jgi:chemotaxis signal transduction protein